VVDLRLESRTWVDLDGTWTNWDHFCSKTQGLQHIPDRPAAARDDSYRTAPGRFGRAAPGLPERAAPGETPGSIQVLLLDDLIEFDPGIDLG
jgi:hypothetical protein